jgi:hypothetical protein
MFSCVLCLAVSHVTLVENGKPHSKRFDRDGEVSFRSLGNTSMGR